MKILWVKAGKLLPVDTGGKIRSFNLLRELNARNDVTLLSYYPGERDPGYEAALVRAFPGAVPVHTRAPDGDAAAMTLDYAAKLYWRAPYAVSRFTSPDVRGLVAQWDAARRFDVSVCDFLSASMNFPGRLHTPSVLFQHNVESILWRRQAATERHPIKRLVYRIEAAKMLRYERATVRRFDHVLAVSEADKAAMAAMTDPSRISVVPTGVDTKAFSPAARGDAGEPVVLFLGSMDWEPNIDGVEHFVEAIWPRVRSAVPGARFEVVGRNPAPAVRRLASDSVRIVGTVPSVVEYLRRAAVVVVPLRVGGGTRLKIYEAMAAAKAVVSTTVGAEGLDVKDGRDIVLADTPDRFAEAVVRVLQDAAERRRLEDAALATALRYDWSAVAAELEAILARAVESSSAAVGGESLASVASRGAATRQGSAGRRPAERPAADRMNVLILDGNENQAVAATRSLARAGHRVLVGADTGWSKAGWSRHAAARFVYPSPETDVESFVAHVAARVRDEGGAFVMPMTERTLLPLSRERARLAEAGAVFVAPPHARVLEACSKEHTTGLARDLGIAVPRTWSAADPAAAQRLATELPYPVVLKPSMSHEPVSTAMRSTGAPAYATGPAEFLDAWHRLARRARTIVVQEFIEGIGAGYFALVRHGEPIVEFAHRRIRDVRPTGSGSAVRESVPLDPAIRDASRRLLAALEWHGVAMVEFRIGRDGTPVFLEVNGRFWNSLSLAIAAGVDFPRYLVDLGTSRDVPAPAAYRAGVRCRWLLGDARHLVEVWRGAPRGYPGRFPSRVATLAAFLTPRPGTVHDNFWWSDPLPELGDWLHFLGRRLPALFRRRGAPADEQSASGARTEERVA